MRFCFGVVVTIVAACILGLTLINTGLLPEITDNCPNGRIVYLQKGHESDKGSLCRALETKE